MLSQEKYGILAVEISCSPKRGIKSQVKCMNISYFRPLALTFVLCTSLLFQIHKRVVTQKPLHSHASSSVLCKASSVVPSQPPVGQRCLRSLHCTQQSQPRCQSPNGPGARATPSPPTEISPGQDGGEATWACRAATLVPSPHRSCLLHNQRALVPRVVIVAPCTEINAF